MKNWRDYFIDQITVEEYFIEVPTQYETLAFVVRYVRRNGYTNLQMRVRENTLPKHKEFAEWLSWHMLHNTRYDKPNWYTRVRLFRKRKIVSWAVDAVIEAYSAWLVETLATPPSELKKA